MLTQEQIFNFRNIIFNSDIETSSIIIFRSVWKKLKLDYVYKTTEKEVDWNNHRDVDWSNHRDSDDDTEHDDWDNYEDYDRD